MVTKVPDNRDIMPRILKWRKVGCPVAPAWFPEAQTLYNFLCTVSLGLIAPGLPRLLPALSGTGPTYRRWLLGLTSGGSGFCAVPRALLSFSAVSLLRLCPA